ncbi:MAG: hypothetical protein IJE23_04645 [Tyzzerella sp.]|nr:hypothetical protein [Tyzzerella sp.]
MKKRISVLSALAAIIAFCCLGCSSKDELKMAEGILRWKPVKGVVNYVVDIDDIRVTCGEAQVNLAEKCEYEGNYTVTVSSVSQQGEIKEIGSIGIKAQTIAKPKVAIQRNEEGQASFVWSPQEGVSGYQYDLHDGYGTLQAELSEDETYRVNFEDKYETMITVTAKGGSKDNVLYMDSSTSYHYDGTELFSMANLVNYPFYMTTDGQLLNELVVGTTLPKGNYDLEMTFYLMDPNGRSLSGNGSWGRRITHLKGNSWFCAEALEGWEGSGNTLPTAIESITYTLNQNVNKYGETTLSLYSWKANEMLVVADVKYNGKSVMADKLIEHKEEEKVVFDVSKLSEYPAVFKGDGTGWNENFLERYEFWIPTDLEDGVYRLEVAYQLMNTDGIGLDGNGTGMRRIYDASMKDVVWWCEYPVEGQTPGMDSLPKSDEVLTSTFRATVVDGKFKLLCLHFKADELLAVKSVKKISGSSRHFELNTLGNYKNVFTCDSKLGSFQKFRVGTTLCQRGQFEVEVSYYVMGSNGYMLDSNGTWGRRIVDEGADEHWICLTPPSDAHPDANNTVPEPDQLVTKKMKVTLNKKGNFFLDMYDFLEGEIVVIADVKYQGESILAK